jgi:hypothetical protein
MSYTAISIKIVSKQSGKVEYERERLAGNRWKINIWFFSDSQPAFRARIRLSRFAPGTTLIEIEVGYFASLRVC